MAPAKGKLCTRDVGCMGADSLWFYFVCVDVLSASLSGHHLFAWGWRERERVLDHL